jgi:hypothetical protein
MIVDKITVLFFKVKLIDSYFFGELKISVLLFPPKRLYGTKIVVLFEE